MTTYRCNKWTFSPKNQEIIYEDGQIQQMPARVSVSLSTLIEAKGNTVTYDELLHKVWGTTHKDASTISSVISELRKRIGCGKDGIKLLVTIPKKGYRFIGEVEVVTTVVNNPVVIDTDASTLNVVSNEQQKPVSVQTPRVPDSSLGRQNTKQATAANLLGVKSMLLIFFGISIAISASLMSSNLGNEATNTPALPSVMFQHHEILTHETGSEVDFDVSEDGLWLIYSHSDKISQKRRLFVKNLQSGLIQALPAVEGSSYESPSFSADLANMAYIINTPTGCEVWLGDFSTLTLETQGHRKISSCGQSGFWTTTAFAKDGHAVFFSRADSLTEPFRVYRHDLRTGYERNMTAPTSSGRGDYAFALSPDGESLAVVRNLLWQSTTILVKKLVDGSFRSVVKLPYLIEHIDWYSDHQIIYRGENWQLYLHNIQTDQREILADMGSPISFPVVSQKRVFAYKGLAYTSALWSIKSTVEPDGKSHYALNSEVSSPYRDFSPTIGAAKMLYFLSNRSGVTRLWQKVGERYSKMNDVELPSQVKNLHFSVEHNAFFGVSTKRLFRFDLNQAKLSWLSSPDSKIRNLSVSDANSLIYSEDENEQWFVKSMDLASLGVTNLNINGFSAHQLDGHVYYTNYRMPGLWRWNINQQVSVKLIDDFSSTSSSYWDIADGKLYQSSDQQLKVYTLDSGELLDDSLHITGFVKNIQCYGDDKGCLLDLNQPGETEIIEFK
jgi:transcriptional activator of cad operon